MRKYNWFKRENKENIISKEKHFWRTLSREAYPITKGKTRIQISLEPFIISKKEYEILRNNLTLFISAARKIASKYFDDKEIKDVIVINKEERILVEKSKNEDFVGIVRIDLFYGKEPKVIEINADFPDGLFMHNITSKAILSNLTDIDLVSPSHIELFHRLLISENIDFKNNIFIGYDKGRKFIDEFALSKIKLDELGWRNVSVGLFDDLAYKYGRFYFQKKRIDVIRRGAELFKLRKIPGFMDKLVAAQKKANVKVINNFKMRLLGHKSLMVALCDSRFHKYLTSEEIRSIKTLLPETIKLNGGKIEKIIKEKDRWVLKPSDLAEGEGISIGRHLTKQEWKLAMENALKNNKHWILQHRVSVPKEEFNSVDKNTGKITSSVKNYDFNPHIFLFKNHNEVGDILVRFSDSDVLNVGKGGGITYAFVEKN